jgi:hypothetical protein
VAAVGEPDVLGHAFPVVDLTARVGVGVRFARAAGARLDSLRLRGECNTPPRVREPA